MLCRGCQEEIPEGRRQLGYDTCLMCGEQEAHKESEYRKKCVAPAYNKGAYQYIHTKKEAGDAGK